METLPMTTGFGQDQAETPGLDNGDNENSCDDDNDNDKKDNDNKNKNDNACFSAALTKSTFLQNLQTTAKLDHAQ